MVCTLHNIPHAIVFDADATSVDVVLKELVYIKINIARNDRRTSRIESLNHFVSSEERVPTCCFLSLHLGSSPGLSLCAPETPQLLPLQTQTQTSLALDPQFPLEASTRVECHMEGKHRLSLLLKEPRQQAPTASLSDEYSTFNGCVSLIAVSIPACPEITSVCDCAFGNFTSSTSAEFRIATHHTVASQSFHANHSGWNSTHPGQGTAQAASGILPTLTLSGAANQSRALQVVPGTGASSGFAAATGGFGGLGWNSSSPGNNWNSSASGHGDPTITPPPGRGSGDGSRGRVPSCIPVGTCFDYMNKCRKRYGW